MSVPSWSSGSSTARIAAGSRVGRSPCRLITRANRRSGSIRPSAWKMRSVPEGRSGSVSTRVAAVRLDRLGDRRLGAGDHHRADGGRAGAPPDLHDHRHAADLGERLVGQAGRTQARRDHDHRGLACHRLDDHGQIRQACSRVARRWRAGARHRAGTDCRVEWLRRSRCGSVRVGAVRLRRRSPIVTSGRNQPAMASSLETNKTLAALLTAGIIASGAGVISRIIYHPSMPEENAYVIEVTEAETGDGEAATRPRRRRCPCCSPRQPRGGPGGGEEVRRLPQLRAGRRQQDRSAAVGRGRARHRLGRRASPIPTRCRQGGRVDLRGAERRSWPIRRNLCPGTKMAFAGIKNPEDLRRRPGLSALARRGARAAAGSCGSRGPTGGRR